MVKSLGTVRVSAAAFAFAVAFAAFACGEPLRAAQTATLDCANSALPPSILAGAAEKTAGTPLALVDVRAPKARLHLAVVNDNYDRDLGLMCVTRLRAHAGMIFVFGQSSDWGFWMKNTLIPLDQIWVEPDGKVDTVAADVPKSERNAPNNTIAHRRGHGIYVIELNANEAAADGITTGSYLVIPTLHAAQ